MGLKLAEATSITFDTFVNVWAIVGPLIVGIASALYNRKIQITDRKFEAERNQMRDAQERLQKQEEHENTLRELKYNEVKMGLADFMASSLEFVKKQTFFMNTNSPENNQEANAANDKFIYSCQIVTLLGNEKVSIAALNLWNTTLEISIVGKDLNKPENEKKLSEYRVARTLFNNVARTYLLELETGTQPDSKSKIEATRNSAT